jgi:hypothetical protein
MVLPIRPWYAATCLKRNGMDLLYEVMSEHKVDTHNLLTRRGLRVMRQAASRKTHPFDMWRAQRQKQKLPMNVKIWQQGTYQNTAMVNILLKMIMGSLLIKIMTVDLI